MNKTYFRAILYLLSSILVFSSLTSAASPASAPNLDQSTPKALLRSFFASRGEVDEPTLRSLLHAATPLEQKILDSVVEVELANARLRAAERQQFGDAAAATTGPTVTSSQGLDIDTARDIDALTEKIEGDRATIASPMDPKIKIDLVRVDGNWKLPIATEAGATDVAVADTIGATARAQVEVIDSLAAEVKAGKFADQEQVRQELGQRLAERLASATRPAHQPATQRAGT